MKQFSFYEYLPKRYAETSGRVSQVRNLIYRFKDGDKAASLHVAGLVSNLLWRWYGTRCTDYTVVCVPSSSRGEYRRRFCYFSAVVASRCREANAMPFVDIIGKRDALHRTANHIVCEDNYFVHLSSDFFKGRKVIVFDDLITTGATAERFAARLAEAGAEVVGAIFIAHTVRGLHKWSYWGRFAEHTNKTINDFNHGKRRMEVAHG